MDKEQKSNLLCYLLLLLIAIITIICGAALWTITPIVLFVGILFIIIYGILDLIEIFKE